MENRGEVGAMTAVMREEGPDVMETATTRVAEVTAVGASATMIITVVTAKGIGEKTRLAEARGTESPRTALRHPPSKQRRVQELFAGEAES